MPMNDDRTRSSGGDAVERAARAVAAARCVAISSGAGMSRESGIPTFREAPGALWKDFDPERFASPEGFRRDPAGVWRWYRERRRMMARVRPHEGHRALARLESLVDEVIVLTQNIDGLHQAAGSRRVVELHGNIHRFRCFGAGHPAVGIDADADEPPRCACGSLVRPAVVWFGEMLDADDLDAAYDALARCDVLLVVGTSATVQPAAEFPALARRHGATVVEINPRRTPASDVATVVVRATARQALPAIVARVEARIDSPETG